MTRRFDILQKWRSLTNASQILHGRFVSELIYKAETMKWPNKWMLNLFHPLVSMKILHAIYFVAI